MAEKIKCEHCYKKYDPTRFKNCPLCGLAQSKQVDIEEFLEENTEEDSDFEVSYDLEDIVNDIAKARSTAKQTAAGLFASLLGSGAGFFLIITGYANQMGCIVNSKVCSGTESIGLGMAIVGISYLVALILSITAMLA